MKKNNMTIKTTYGYTVDLGNLESDVYIENEEGRIVVALTPMDILKIRNKVVEKIEKDYGEN